MPERSKKLLKLELEVAKGSITWLLAEVREGGDVKLANDNMVCDALFREGPGKATIRLLVGLQRRLADSLADRTPSGEQLQELEKDLCSLPEILGQNLYSDAVSDHTRQAVERHAGRVARH